MIAPIANSNRKATPLARQSSIKQPKFLRVSNAAPRTDEQGKHYPVAHRALMQSQLKILAADLHPRKLIGWQHNALCAKRRNSH
jgi:hypothetical protein